MKTTLFLLAVLVSFFVIGCQDNNATNPVASSVSSQSSLAPSYNQPTKQQVIPLSGFLREPRAFNSWLEIKGEVVASISGGRLIELALVVDAALSDPSARPYGKTYTVAGSTCDRIKLSTDGAATVVKAYKIEGRDDGAYLQLLFNITTAPLADAAKRIELAGMAIKMPGRPVHVASAHE